MATTDLRASSPEEPRPRRDVAESFGTGAWQFTPEVVGVFDEHVRAHSPHYDVVQRLVTEVADWALPAGGVFADLGASTGETVRALHARHGGRTFSAHLYDESTAMLDRAKATINAPGAGGERGPVYFHSARLPADGLQHEAADLTTAIYLLQFLPPADRIPVLTQARRAAAKTGALLVAEKIRPPDSRWAEIANARSHDWKAEHGVSDDAIRAKERSLRGVLRPTTVDSLRNEIVTAGWDAAEVLFAWHSWVVVGAFA